MKKIKNRLTNEEKSHLEEVYKQFLNDERILKMKQYTMHRGSNCYIHSFKVAKISFKMALNSRKKLDLESLLIGAFLHDYYLYDWRDDHSLLKHHAKNHPFIAYSNASKDFSINVLEAEIIKSHMWPYNIKNFPKSTEAKIVGFCDTLVATIEGLTSRKYKQKRIDKTNNYLKTLF